MPNKKSLRNLPQYRQLPEDEYNAIADRIISISKEERDFDDLIAKEIQKYEESYDLSELMPNDRTLLETLVVKTILQKKSEIQLNTLLVAGATDSNSELIKKLNEFSSTLTNDIIKLQDALKITRKSRKSEKEENVIAFLDNLKSKAKKFYDQKMLYILCPDCKQLIATLWMQNTSSKSNKLYFYCHKCGKDSVVHIAELVKEKLSSNVQDSIPETLR